MGKYAELEKVWSFTFFFHFSSSSKLKYISLQTFSD